MSPFPPETVVVVHGLWMNGAEAGLLRHRLSDEHGYPTVLFQYGTFEAGFADQRGPAARLRWTQIESPRIHLVGHSTGGVMALVALQRRPLSEAGPRGVPRVAAPGQHGGGEAFPAG